MAYAISKARMNSAAVNRVCKELHVCLLAISATLGSRAMLLCRSAETTLKEKLSSKISSTAVRAAHKCSSSSLALTLTGGLSGQCSTG
eukprot:765709-Amphidinium_carterae.1